jgi:crossover junction endodeoxyribonuclease RuvC
MGFGLVKVSAGPLTLLEMGVLKLSKYKEHTDRLEMIFRKMESLIKIYQPDAVAIEAPFFGKNVQSMLKLGRAQGVAMAAAMMNGLQATEYAPRKVKQSVTGRGNASKEQVWEMIKHTLHLQESDFQFFDATDAVAVALCHHYQVGNKIIEVARISGFSPKTKKYKPSTWDAFIAQNPNRIKN